MKGWPESQENLSFDLAIQAYRGGEEVRRREGEQVIPLNAPLLKTYKEGPHSATASTRLSPILAQSPELASI